MNKISVQLLKDGQIKKHLMHFINNDILFLHLQDCAITLMKQKLSQKDVSIL